MCESDCKWFLGFNGASRQWCLYLTPHKDVARVHNMTPGLMGFKGEECSVWRFPGYKGSGLRGLGRGGPGGSNPLHSASGFNPGPITATMSSWQTAGRRRKNWKRRALQSASGDLEAVSARMCHSIKSIATEACLSCAARILTDYGCVADTSSDIAVAKKSERLARPNNRQTPPTVKSNTRFFRFPLVLLLLLLL